MKPADFGFVVAATANHEKDAAKKVSESLLHDQQKLNNFKKLNTGCFQALYDLNKAYFDKFSKVNFDQSKIKKTFSGYEKFDPANFCNL